MKGGLGKDNRWHNISYIDQHLLERKWQYFLLTRLRKYLPKNERTKKLIDKLFKEKRSFITYAKKEKKRKVDIVGYLIKYVVSSPISYRRIIEYKNEEVTFRYQTREKAKNKVKKLTALGFIYLLVQHILGANQKMIHYYGLYTRAKRMKKVVEKLIRSYNEQGWEKEQEKLLSEILSFPTTYRERIKISCDKDPRMCPVYGDEMVIEKIVGPYGCVIFDLWKTDYFQDVTNEEKKKSSQALINYYCPSCKNKQVIPKQMAYDFTKGKHSHRGGTTAFVCTKCGSPMRKEDV